MKYRKAANDFISQLGYTYNLILDLIDHRYNMINPLVTGFVNEEKRFFAAVNELFKKFDGLNAKILNMDRQFKKTVNNYDPAKFVRGHKLLTGINFSGVTFQKGEIKNNNTKFTYNDYVNKKNTSTNNTKVDAIQQNLTNQNKDSYEHYKSNTNLENNFFTNTGNDNFSGFSAIDNNFSKQNKVNNSEVHFDFMNNSVNNMNAVNKINNNSLKKTTVVPQFDDYSSSFHQDQHVDNPYGQIDLNGNIKTEMGPTFGSKSQFPTTSNQLNMGSNISLNNTAKFPNFSEINRGGGGNLSFPKK